MNGKKQKNTIASKPPMKANVNPMRGGHFAAGPDPAMAAINCSLNVDRALYKQDIQGSIAHARMLAKQKIIERAEAQKIVQGLKQIEKEIESGMFPFRPELEDIHMNIEARLAEKIGDAAGKLHTARSRNDQVATGFRLWIRDAIDRLDHELKQLQKALMTQAERHADTVMPGFTHLQVAQPVTFGHHLMAYVEMLGRDRARLADTRKRLNESPLGAAALAGTSFPIDRHATTQVLAFDRPMANSLDAVSDRDFAIEYLHALALGAVHFSRLAEEMVIWCSTQFGFIVFSEKFTSGSSIMPQKRNPDAAELVRAKTGRLNGALIGLLTVMKGLPLAYSKDMQEDKKFVFEATEDYSLCLAAMQGMIVDMKPNREAMQKAASQGYSTATDLADWLVQNLGIPFRKSHYITGRIVRLAEKKKISLPELSLKEMQSVEAKITAKIFDVLSVEQSVHSRKSYGGTSPSLVREAVKEARKKYL